MASSAASASRSLPLPDQRVGARERDLRGGRNRQRGSTARIRRRGQRRVRADAPAGTHAFQSIITSAPSARPIASTSSRVSDARAARRRRADGSTARRGRAQVADLPDGDSSTGREAIEAIEQRQRFFRWRAALDGGGQQPARVVGVAALKGGGAGLQQLLAFALPLGDARCARARCRRAPAAWLRSRNSARVQTLMASSC